MGQQAPIQTGYHRFTEIGQIFMNDSQKKKFPGKRAPGPPPRTLRLRRLLFRKSVTISSRSAPGQTMTSYIQNKKSQNLFRHASGSMELSICLNEDVILLYGSETLRAFKRALGKVTLPQKILSIHSQNRERNVDL